MSYDHGCSGTGNGRSEHLAWMHQGGVQGAHGDGLDSSQTVARVQVERKEMFAIASPELLAEQRPQIRWRRNLQPQPARLSPATCSQFESRDQACSARPPQTREPHQFLGSCSRQGDKRSPPGQQLGGHHIRSCRSRSQNQRQELTIGEQLGAMPEQSFNLRTERDPT